MAITELIETECLCNDLITIGVTHMSGDGYSYSPNGPAEFSFKGRSTIQPATHIAVFFFCLAIVQALGVVKPWLIIGVIIGVPCAIEFYLNRRNREFIVSPQGISIKGELIPIGRINSVELSNSKGKHLSENFLVDATATMAASQGVHDFAARYYYCVTVLHGGKRTKLAGGMKHDSARGLAADVQRALQGTLA